MTSEKVYPEFDSSKLLMFLYRWRKAFLVTAIVAAVVAMIISSSLFIDPLYRSNVIMYPASSNSISKSLLNDNAGAKQDLLEFGEDAQTEQMLQVLNSNKIKDRIIKTFDLARHYGIDTSSRYKNLRLYRQYESNITFKRTEYMAVKISVLDHDPQMAADIANTIAALLDTVKNDMQKERAIQGFRIMDAEYEKLKAEIRVMEDSLTELRKLGVHDYETQAEMINQQLAIEIAKGNNRGIDALDNKLKVLAQYGGPYVSLRDALEYEKKQLSFVKAKYEEAKIDATQYIPQKFVVETAYKSERKAYPIRWIIVTLFTLGALFMAAMVILLLENAPLALRKMRGQNHEPV
jgi:capsular polysaccharide biosynthesis protein